MNATPKRLQHRKTSEVRQAEIVDVAIRIIADEGPRNFTAKRVADEVGITSGAIFRHFDSMASIVDRAVGRIGVILADDFPDSTRDPLERLQLFFFNRTRTIAAHPQISRLLLSDHLAEASGSAEGDRLGKFKKRTKKFVAQCLRDAEESGYLAAGVDTDAATLLVLGAVLALSHSGTRAVRTAEAERLARDVWTVIERMLESGPPQPNSN